MLLGWIDAGWFDRAPVIAELAQWRKLLVLVGVPGIVLQAFLFLIPEPARRHSFGLLPLSDVVRRLVADNGTVLRVCVVKGALGIGDYGLVAWLPTLLQRAYGMTPLEAGGILALSV